MFKKQVKFSSKSLCKAYGFGFTCNKNIGRNFLWRDGIHLKNEGMSLFSRNLLKHLNSCFNQNMDFSVNYENKT